MKKISLTLMFAFGMMFVLSSHANNKAEMPATDLKTNLDSLAYAIGLSSTQGMSQYLMQSGVNPIHFNALIQGLLDAASTDDEQRNAYNIGLQFGQRYNNKSFDEFNRSLFSDPSSRALSKEQFMAGVIAGILETDMLMNPEEANEYANKTVEKIKAEESEKQFAENKAAGIAFLKANKSKKKVVTLPSGLQYKIITATKGVKPTKEDKVKVHYKGTLIDGTEFDSSYGRGEPAVFGVTQVIAGWTEALQLMPVGSTWELYIPQELAYGAKDMGTIKPFSTLVFQVELISIENDAVEEK